MDEIEPIEMSNVVPIGFAHTIRMLRLMDQIREDLCKVMGLPERFLVDTAVKP